MLSVRTRAALVAAATLTGLLVAPTSAAAVAETCQGLPATILAKSKKVTYGTEGDDVILGQHAYVDALGGNDLICLDSGDAKGGDGNDSVLVTGTDPKTSVAANLGAGDDRYVGGPGRDYVNGGIPLLESLGSNIISTGSGRDQVQSGDADEPNRDVVDLGNGDDQLVTTLPPGSSAHFQSGNGSDRLDFTGAAGDHVFDLAAGIVTRAGVEAASLSGFEVHFLSVPRPGVLRVLGTPGPDTLYLDAERTDLQLGDGSDGVTIGNSAIAFLKPSVQNASVHKSLVLSEAGVIDLGPGKDFLRVAAKRRVVADLARGRLAVANSLRHRGRLTFLGAEALIAVADRVVLSGGPGADLLIAGGCHAQLSGQGGADYLSRRGAGFISSEPAGQHRVCGAVESGGRGRDLLVGGDAADQLLGGPGRDVARGGPGTDTCRAERKVSCEL